MQGQYDPLMANFTDLFVFISIAAMIGVIAVGTVNICRRYGTNARDLKQARKRG